MKVLVAETGHGVAGFDRRLDDEVSIADVRLRDVPRELHLSVPIAKRTTPISVGRTVEVSSELVSLTIHTEPPDFDAAEQFDYGTVVASILPTVHTSHQ